MRFLYFDLGNVLIHFSQERGCRQMAKVAGVTPDQVHHALFETDLLEEVESGRIDDEAFYEAFCQLMGTRPPPAELAHAGCDIFSINASMTPLVDSLRDSGVKMGILSNTCAAHWRFVKEHFTILDQFTIHATSFELGAIKPAPLIYEKAANLAGADPGDIFFTDDRMENVEGARQAGWDAVLFTGAADLAEELYRRDLLVR